MPETMKFVHDIYEHTDRNKLVRKIQVIPNVHSKIQVIPNVHTHDFALQVTRRQAGDCNVIIMYLTKEELYAIGQQITKIASGE